MRDDLAEGNLIMFAISSVFVQSLNDLRSLFLLQEFGPLREVDKEKPGDEGYSDSDRTFNDVNKSPAGKSICMNMI